MSCSDDSLRKRSLVSLREYLSLFDHVSLLGLLQVLKRDCPFPRVGGLLLDIVRDHSQACSVSSMSSRSPLSHTACLAAKNSLSCTSQAGSTGPHDVRRITREDAAPLLWDGSGSSIFFSEVSLRAFCVPPLEKIRDASTQQILDSVDEIGGAINLLLHYSIKISRILKDLATDSPALIQQLHSFLGQQGGNATEGDVTSNDESNAAAVTITRDLFHIEIRSLVEEVAQVVRSKLLKVESKVGGASGGFLPRNPWQTPEERGASTVVECEGEGEEAAVDAAVPVPLPPSDLLQLEIILDNLEFLLRVL